MAEYFLSDVHLRLDHPERGERLAHLVDRLGPTDALTIVGDLCDFWFGARQMTADPMTCPGLRALAQFRARGGEITSLAGNHDAWLGPFYEQTFGARFGPASLERNLAGQRTLITHGHRFGARTNWKAGLESRAFLAAFRTLPAWAANRLGDQLNRTNSQNQDVFDRRGRAIYEAQVERLGNRYDRVILGHVHQPWDSSKLVILGGWQEGSAYLVWDEGQWRHVITPA